MKRHSKKDLNEEAEVKKSSGAGSDEKEGANHAKEPKQANRALGTCHYMAPEVINGEENTKALDFWSLGVIVYEFLTGGLPFQADSPFEVFKRIKARDIKYPPVGREEGMMTPEAHDFIDKLLISNPKERLGTKSIEEVKGHPFFAGFEWTKISEMDPPFKPAGRDQDATYFPKANE